MPGAEPALGLADHLTTLRAHYAAGRLAECLRLTEDTLTKHGETALLMFIKGMTVFELAEDDAARLAAIEALRRATLLAPGEHLFHYNLGFALHRMQRNPEAMLALRHCLRRDPTHMLARRYMAEILLGMDRPEEALHLVEGMAPAERSIPEILALEQRCRMGMHDFAESLAVQDHVLAGTHGRSGIFAEGCMRLSLRDFDKGWDCYSQRENKPASGFEELCPEWQGEPLAGKTLMAVGEQGLGDEIMFASCFPDVIAEAAHVILLSRDTLYELFTASFPGTTVLSHAGWGSKTALPPDLKPDYWAFIGDLPRRKRRQISAFPGTPYLTVPQAEVLRMGAIMDQLAPTVGQRRRIGLVWATGTINAPEALRYAAKKSIAPLDLAVLSSVPDVTWFSLQNVNHAPQTAFVPGVDVVDLSPHLGGFIDTAAAMRNLDLIITVDTAHCHLAGALGLPTLVILPKDCDWRWSEGHSTSYWYQNMTLFRNPSNWNWTAPLAAIVAALQSPQKRGALPRHRALGWGPIDGSKGPDGRSRPDPSSSIPRNAYGCSSAR